MGLKRALTVTLALTALLAGTLLAVELLRWRQVATYNAMVAQARFDTAGAGLGEHGLFAQAYAEHQARRYQEARVIYGQLENTADHALRTAVLYNTGNTYLQQAAGIDLAKDPDLAVPLIELAKVSYREALRLDNDAWDARFNLERALQLSPDAAEQKLMDLKGLRGTVRTVIATDPEGDLP